MKPDGSVGPSSRMSSTAPGTVIVISSARMPPSAMASTTARSLLGSLMRMTATMPASSTARTTSAARSWAIWFVISAYRNSSRLRASRSTGVGWSARRPAGRELDADSSTADYGPRTADPRTIIALLHGYGPGRPIRQRTRQRRQHRPGRELRSHAHRERCAASRRSAAGRARAGRAHRREPADRPCRSQGPGGDRRRPGAARLGHVYSGRPAGARQRAVELSRGAARVLARGDVRGAAHPRGRRRGPCRRTGHGGAGRGHWRWRCGECSRRCPIRTASSCTTSTSIGRSPPRRAIRSSRRSWRWCRRSTTSGGGAWSRAPASGIWKTRRACTSGSPTPSASGTPRTPAR